MPNNENPDEPLVRPLTDELSAAVAEDLENFDAAAAEEGSAAALDREEPGVASSGLLSFYDRLRERMVRTVEKRGGKMSRKAVRALLFVPDVFILLVRLSLDKEVPGSARALIGGTLAYFLLPADLFPEALLGGIGYMDDLILATAVLAQTFGGELEPYARKHWSGSEDLRVVLRDITEAASSLLGQNVFTRLKKLMGRRGIRIDKDE